MIRSAVALLVPEASDDVVEFIAGMTDRFALSYAERLSA